MIQLPRLLDSSMKEIARLSPSSLALDLYMVPLSTATMVLDESQPTVNAGAFVEIFTASGSAGIFRVQQTAQEVGGARTISLEHGIVTLSDNIIPSKLEKPETTTVRAAMTKLLENQALWELGTVEIPDAKTISWEYDYSALLDSVLSIMDRFPDYRLTFDQSTTPWKVNIVSVPTETASECRLTRNIVSLSVEEDFSEICTRLYIPNRAEPLEADTIGTWGAVTRSLAGDEGLTEDELLAYGQRYLDGHKNPALTVTIDALDLSAATGESMDALHLGYLCRVCLPDYGQTISQRITALSYPDLLSSPGSVTVTLANAAENTATTLSSLMVDTTIQRRLIYKNGQELDRLVVRTIANEDAIEIIAPKIDVLAVNLEAQVEESATLKAGLEDLNTTVTVAADGITADVSAQGETLSSFKVRIDEISSTVKDTEGNLGSLVVKSDSIRGKLEDATGKITALVEMTDEHFASLQGDIDTIDGDVKTITGSAIWQRRDNITAAVGKMYVGSDGKLHIVDGSGLVMDDGSSSMGVYTEGNLTAGVLVQKLNNGTTTTKIKADVIQLDGYVTISSMEAEFAELLDGFAMEFSTTDLHASTIALGQSLTAPEGYVSANTLMAAASITVDGHEVATQDWVASAYIPKANLSTLATQMWVGTNYQLKSGLTTKTVTVVTNVDYSTATTPPFYNAQGTQVSNGLQYVKGISKTTEDITFVVYA